jgi:simple sugar transport system permease protein
MIQHSLPAACCITTRAWSASRSFCLLLRGVFADHQQFLTGTNWLNIIRQSAPLLIVATAMTLVITTGGIDLSVGSTLALVGAFPLSP